MGVITNGSGGGAGGGIRYNAQTDMIQVKVNGQWVDTPYKAYGTFDGTIYDNGAQAVSLDNSGYPRNSYYTSLGGATLSSGSFNFTTSGMSANTDKSIVTDTKIDLTGWNTLYITTGLGTVSIDVSAINQMAYVVIDAYCTSGGVYKLAAYVSTEKTYCETEAYRLAWYDMATGTSDIATSIRKIWLE